MKAQILIEMPENELNDLLVTERERLVKMKMSHAVSPMENPLQIKFTRKRFTWKKHRNKNITQ